MPPTRRVALLARAHGRRPRRPLRRGARRPATASRLSTRVHLLDGTYELFRHHFAVPPSKRDPGDDVAGTRGVLWSVLSLFEEGVTHLAVATDHVVESFRNDMWPGYKSSAGVAEAILAQFPLVEESLEALGVVVWPMTGLEADDGLASGARTAAADPSVDQVVILTPDKDLSQCVVGQRVVQFDRRAGRTIDEKAVVATYGVHPESIPDWLALVGDSSDGYPGLPGWGPKAAAAVLGRYRHLEEIPEHHWRWDVDVRGRQTLAATLADRLDEAFLFRDLATLRADAPLFDRVDDLRWRGARPELEEVARRLRAPRLVERSTTLAAAAAAREAGDGGAG